MILRSIVGTEKHPAYQDLLHDNLARQYSFLSSLIGASVRVRNRELSEGVIKSLQFHAVACLDCPAGSYRKTAVTVGDYVPPAHEHVPELMRDFVQAVNQRWAVMDPFGLSAYCLWQINRIHPFVNGNGRTARALCHYVFCAMIGGEAGADGVFLPELIRNNRPEYVDLLKACDERGSQLPLRHFLVRLLRGLGD